MKSHATDGSRGTIEPAIGRLKPALKTRPGPKAQGQSVMRDWQQSMAGVLPIHVAERQVCEATGLHRATIRRMEARGDFPGRRQLSPGRVGWPLSEIQKWLESRPATRELESRPATREM